MDSAKSMTMSSIHCASRHAVSSKVATQVVYTQTL
ncbi:hypothetical protein ABIB26_001068 [Arthrobacter sp. UYEF20]